MRTLVGAPLAILLLAIGASAARATSPPAHGERDAGAAVGDLIRSRLEHGARAAVGGEADGGDPMATQRWQIPQGTVHARQALPAFYEARLYAPVWVTDSKPRAALPLLVDAVRAGDDDGLDPADYHLETLEELLGIAQRSQPPDTRLLSDLELAATDAFLLLGAHLVSGRVDPESLDPLWMARRREVDLVATLQRVAAGEGPQIALANLLPEQPGYHRLKRAFAEYRRLEADGGWPQVTAGEALRLADRGPRVAEIRARLAVTDPSVATDGADPELFDEALLDAVVAFQLRHGLAADGVVGDQTLAALATPVADRVRQIELSLERWRWLPQDLGERYLLVNIPELTLGLYEGTAESFVARVAVGRRYRRTPVFSDQVRYLVINPYWDVPHKLAVQDKLPEIKEDPAYLTDNGFTVYPGWGSEQVAVDPATVDWQALGPGSFPYRLRQAPGPKNALGRIKFMFPNRFDVYIHDTPNRKIFSSAERDVSSGCIRVERPIDLAELLLADRPEWSRAALDAAIAGGREQVIPLAEPVPVHLLYWTAWVDEAGTTHFRRDLYGRDDALAEALAAPPPL